MKHTLSILVENKPGVLTRVAGLFARRGFNIESLAVGLSEDPGLSRITIVIDGDEHPVDQVTKQLHKLINVLKIRDLDPGNAVSAELLLVRVAGEGDKRDEVLQIAEIFKAKIVDVDRRSLTLLVVGADDKVEALLELLEPLGILEVVRAPARSPWGAGGADARPRRRGSPDPEPRLRPPDVAVDGSRIGVHERDLAVAAEGQDRLLQTEGPRADDQRVEVVLDARRVRRVPRAACELLQCAPSRLAHWSVGCPGRNGLPGPGGCMGSASPGQPKPPKTTIVFPRTWLWRPAWGPSRRRGQLTPVGAVARAPDVIEVRALQTGRPRRAEEAVLAAEQVQIAILQTTAAPARGVHCAPAVTCCHARPSRERQTSLKSVRPLPPIATSSPLLPPRT